VEDPAEFEQWFHAVHAALELAAPDSRPSLIDEVAS